MAAWEPKKQGLISQVSWTDGTAQDVYYGQEHSFQYSANVNCDDEMHGIKLSNKARRVNYFPKCQLVSCGENGVMAIDTTWGVVPRIFNHSSFSTNWTPTNIPWYTKVWWNIAPWVVFQDNVWYWTTTTVDNNTINALAMVSNTWAWTGNYVVPFDHPEATDESIMTPAPSWGESMAWPISAMLNYNNTRLVVACGSWKNQPTSIWVYYPELDNYPNDGGIYRWRTWWKKVLQYEAWVTVVALTCTFEYLKVWAVDEWWNTKVYYYQGNNNLRDTFVYNVVDLTWERVLKAYSINWTDYYITSIDGTDGYVNLNKMVGNTPVMLFHQRAWLDPLDVNFKAPYFVWPVSINAAYKSGRFYIWDQYWVFQFTQNQTGYDKGYMKWKLRDYTHQGTTPVQVYWLCENQGYLYVSDSEWCWEMRLYDTWVDGYQSEWVLISREYEGKEWWTITKMLDEIRLNYELNPLTDNTGSIDVYVSPNNLRKNTRPEWTWLPTNMSTYKDNDNYDWWFYVMHIDWDSQRTRTERSNLLNNLDDWNSAFGFDRQTITYAIVINQNTSTHATPIIRQIDIKYHTKDKVNNVYDINTSD